MKLFEENSTSINFATEIKQIYYGGSYLNENGVQIAGYDHLITIDETYVKLWELPVKNNEVKLLDIHELGSEFMKSENKSSFDFFNGILCIFNIQSGFLKIYATKRKANINAIFDLNKQYEHKLEEIYNGQINIRKTKRKLLDIFKIHSFVERYEKNINFIKILFLTSEGIFIKCLKQQENILTQIEISEMPPDMALKQEQKTLILTEKEKQLKKHQELANNLQKIIEKCEKQITKNTQNLPAKIENFSQTDFEIKEQKIQDYDKIYKEIKGNLKTEIIINLNSEFKEKIIPIIKEKQENLITKTQNYFQNENKKIIHNSILFTKNIENYVFFVFSIKKIDVKKFRNYEKYSIFTRKNRNFYT